MTIQLLPWKFDTKPLCEQLKDPSVWNQVTMRRESPNSPHYGCDDIYVRFNPPAIHYDKEALSKPYEFVWYNLPIEEEVKKLVYPLMANIEGPTELGGVLITRIPSGRCVRVHSDGGWNALNYTKYGIQLKGDKWQGFCFENEIVHPDTGDSFWFINQEPHWVYNCSYQERISMIVSIKTPRSPNAA